MKTLYNFKKFVDELSIDNSRNYKISVLEKYKDDEDIKYYLDFVFNPFITTGISDKKLNRLIETDYTTKLDNVKDILNYSKTHNTGSDKDLAIIFTNRDTLFEDFDFNAFVDDANIQTEQDFQDLIASLYDLFNKIVFGNLNSEIPSLLTPIIKDNLLSSS